MSKQKLELLVFKDPSPYRDSNYDWIYRFPIGIPVSPVTGRMLISLEPVIYRGKIVAIRLDFRGESGLGSFEIPTQQSDKGTIITSHIGKDSFFDGAWSLAPCQYHKGCVVLSSYVPDSVKSLIVETLTTAISLRYTRDVG